SKASRQLAVRPLLIWNKIHLSHFHPAPSQCPCDLRPDARSCRSGDDKQRPRLSGFEADIANVTILFLRVLQRDSSAIQVGGFTFQTRCSTRFDGDSYLPRLGLST